MKRARPGFHAGPETASGRIVSAHGRQYVVETESGLRLGCFPRGKRSELAVGDLVHFEQINAEQGVIVDRLPRTSLLHRSDAYREKLIAANVTQVVIVVATQPQFSAELVTRCLIGAESQGLEGLIVLNKCDLGAELPAARARIAPFARLGIPVIELSAQINPDALMPRLVGHRSILVGQSGMGKSTLINALVPGADTPTREISTALGSGKHTTTHATYYALPSGGALIDSPGLQEFGLRHLDPEQLANAFVEFRPHLGHCRFRDCRHQSEPDCAIRTAVGAGMIDPDRLATFGRLLQESKK